MVANVHRSAYIARVLWNDSSRPCAFVHRLLYQVAKGVEIEASRIDPESDRRVCENLEAQARGALIVEVTEFLAPCLR